VRIIDQSKSPFEKNAYLDRVFDPDFPENKRYAELLVQEIPPGKRWDILIEVYRRKEEGKGSKRKLFKACLLTNLTADEDANFCDLVSGELKTTNSEATIRTIRQIMPPEYWPKLSEIARIRIEGKFIESIKEGRYNV
jgi:hypothetical protein